VKVAKNMAAPKKQAEQRRRSPRLVVSLLPLLLELEGGARTGAKRLGGGALDLRRGCEVGDAHAFRKHSQRML
jgi:hypothetical protein